MWPLALAAGASELFSGQLFQVTATVWKPQHRALSERGEKSWEKKSNNTFIRTWGGTKKKRKEKAWRLRHWLGVCVCVFAEMSPKRPQMSHQGLVALFLLTWIKLSAEQPALQRSDVFLGETAPCVPLGQDATRTAAPVKNVSGSRSESHLWQQEGENVKDLTLTLYSGYQGWNRTCLGSTVLLGAHVYNI